MKSFLLISTGIVLGIWLSAVWRGALDNARRTLRDQQRRMRDRVGEL